VVFVNIIKYLGKSSAGLLDAILPARCPISGETVGGPGLVIPQVWQKLDFIHNPICARCGIRFDLPEADPEDLCGACLARAPHFDAARTVMGYDEASRDMILAFKHGDQTHLVATFGPWMARVADEFRDRIDVVMPVPLHPWRLWLRRYNQAGLLARDLAARFHKPFVPGVLRRVKHTASMGYMTKIQRQKNIAGAFRIEAHHRQAVRGQRILLIDDVYTTGATVNTAARALKRAGAGAVYVVTLARVMRPMMIDPKDRYGAGKIEDEGI
jgi:ComF family protein